MGSGFELYTSNKWVVLKKKKKKSSLRIWILWRGRREGEGGKENERDRQRWKKKVSERRWRSSGGHRIEIKKDTHLEILGPKDPHFLLSPFNLLWMGPCAQKREAASNSRSRHTENPGGEGCAVPEQLGRTGVQKLRVAHRRHAFGGQLIFLPASESRDQMCHLESQSCFWSFNEVTTLVSW